MKTQIKRFSKSTLAVVLTLCMLISCMTVGIVATDAAVVSDSGVVGGYAGESVGADTWYLRGTNNSWGTSDPMTSAGNNMYARVASFSSNGSFKIDKNGSWTESYPSSNYGISAGTYMITFNSSTYAIEAKKLPVNVTGTLGGTAWDPTDTTNNMTTTNDYVFTKSYPVTAKQYQYKLTYGNAWGSEYGSGNTGDVTVGTNLTKGTTSDGNLTVTPSKAGTLTFSYNYITNKLTLSLEVAATTYTGIKAEAKGSTNGSTFNTTLSGTPATISNTSYTTGNSALTITASPVSGYSFYKWVVTAGSGTIGTATSAITTFTPSASNTTVTAQYKKSYDVTKNTPDNGTITLNKTTVLAGDTFKVTLAPSAGYKVATFTVGGVDKKSSLNSSNEYTHTATGTGSSFAVNATFEAIPATTIYIKNTVNTENGFTHVHLWNPSNDANLTVAGSWPGDKFTDWSTTADGKYYYKAYTWDCAKFKLILNNGSSSSQTNNQGAEYDTGNSYYIDAATAGTAAVLTEGVPQSSTITYTPGTGFSYSENDTTSAYTGETVNFKVTPSSGGYRIVSVTYTPAGGTATPCTAGSNNTYSFTMPDKNVTINVTAVKTYTVSLSVDGGVNTKKYRVGTSGSYQDYSSILTVDEGSVVYFQIAYKSGYEYNSISGATVETANTVFKTAAVNANTTVSLTSKKTAYTVSTAAKYSNTGASNTYTNDLAASITTTNITNGTATAVDGFGATAPPSVTVDGVTYQFAQWKLTNCTATYDATQATNTFKPTANGAVATAEYKKVYTISVTVDTAGATGTGTASVSPTAVVAGGTATVTATHGTHSAVDYIKYGTTTSSNDVVTINNIQENKDVHVKFKSTVMLKGDLNSWAGEEMTSNADGTSFTITKVINANQSIAFKHYVEENGGTWSDTVATNGWQLGSFADHGTADDGNGGHNLTITAKNMNIRVTFTSDGAKFTSIKAAPATDTKVNVTFKQVDGVTITGTYDNTAFSTASADAVVQVYEGDEISFTATAGTGKYISGLTGATFTPAFAAGASYTGKIASVTSATTVTPTVGTKLAVKVKTNADNRGTISVDKSTAVPGEKITVSVNEIAGTISKIVVKPTAGGDSLFEWTYSNGTATRTKGSAPTGANANKAGASVSAQASASVGAADSVQFNIPSVPVTVEATFNEYTAPSNWYYNGYDKDSGAQITGFYDQQMTEGKLNGVEYSYFNVSGRTQGGTTDQAFKVAKKSGSAKLYIETPNTTDWNGNDGLRNPYIYWFDDNWGTFEKLTYVKTIDGGKKWWYTTNIHAGQGCCIVNMNNTSDGGFKQTADISADDVSYGAVWISSGMSNNKYTIGGRFSANDKPSDAGTGITEYSWDNNVYKEALGFNGGFWDWDHNYARPKDLGTDKDDYYILVFYPGKSYSYNGETLDLTSATKPVVVWSPTLPGESGSQYITIYGKDGSLRNDSKWYDSSGNEHPSVYEKYARHADTHITSAGGTETRNDSENYTTIKVERGSSITVTTTIDSDWRDDFYIRGFCVNGVTPELYDWNSNGVYTMTIDIDDEWEYVNGKYLEITPIYYPKAKEGYRTITFYVRGYDENVIASWGNTIAAYPFYDGCYNQDNAFGGYPGQPMINYGGKRFIEIPEYSFTGEGASQVDHKVTGITLSNYYWDKIHGTTDNENNFKHIKAVSTHCQTYDYDDFSKIYNENSGDLPDLIIFDFKYETAYNNEHNGANPKTSADTYANGWEYLTDAQGNKVDIFGNVLTDTQAAADPIYVVSDGYWNTYSGAYSTEWQVFDQNGTSIGMLAPSVRWIKDAARVTNSYAPYAYNSGSYTLDQIHSLDDYTATYNALKNANTGKVGVPVKITYEKEIRNESGQTDWDNKTHNSNDNDKAKRSDGLWMYSYNGILINANVKIEAAEEVGGEYTERPFVGTTNASSEGLKAYFTNDAWNGQTAVETRSDKDDNFKFKAESAGTYKFVGWWLQEGEGENAKLHKISSVTAAESSMESNATFIARFVKTTSGPLTITHTVKKDSTYQGDGVTAVTVVVYDNDEKDNILYSSLDSTKNEVTIPDQYIKGDEDYYVVVTLLTDATGDDTFARFDTSEVASKFYDSAIESTSNPKSVSSIFAFYTADLFHDGGEGVPVQDVAILRYYSQLTQVKYIYDIKYHYTSYRNLKSTQTYRIQGTFADSDLASYFVKGTIYDNDSKVNISDRYIFDGNDKKAAFLNKMGPYENNFLKTISWNTTAAEIIYRDNDKSYTIDVYSTENLYDKVKVHFFLPYNHEQDNKKDYAAIPTDGRVLQDRTKPVVKIDSLDQMTWYATNGAKANSGTEPTFITAPAVIYNGETALYFRYWSVKTLTVNDETDVQGIEYTRCFAREFNLAIYQDSYVEPVYTELTSDEINANYTPSPSAEAKKNSSGATITFMENSRNQYNDGGCGTETNTKRKQMGDRVFTDFLISFASEGDLKFKDYAAGTYTVGIAIERVEKLSKNSKLDYQTESEAAYKEQYGATIEEIGSKSGMAAGEKRTEIMNFIEGIPKSLADGNTEGVVKYQKGEKDGTVLDNKNRMDFYYSMSVRSHTDFSNTHNSEYVYRAYSYLKDKNGNVIMLSDTPLYFTIYDMASITNATEGITFDAGN